MNEVFKRYATLTGRLQSRGDAKANQLLERALRNTVLPIIPADRSVSMLDAGCGDGMLLRLLMSEGYRQLDGIDLSEENVGLCQRQGLVAVAQCDVCDMARFKPGMTWDCILLWDVIEHLPGEHAIRVLSDLRGRLRPGGCLVLQTPNMGSLFAAFGRFADVTHLAGYTEGSLKTLLLAAGFPRVDVGPAWRRTTLWGRIREGILRAVHALFWVLYGNGAPRIASPNLIARAKFDA